MKHPFDEIFLRTTARKNCDAHAITVWTVSNSFVFQFRRQFFDSFFYIILFPIKNRIYFRRMDLLSIAKTLFALISNKFKRF